MKIPTIQFVEKGKAVLTETEFVCEAGPGEVLLKTECTLISPGTEFACLNGNTNRGTVKFPMTLGYSAVARVLETGEGVTEFQPGDRCLCYHTGHRSYQRCPAEKVVKIESDTLPSEEAVFCVVGCMGFQGVRRCRPEFGESMMVMVWDFWDSLQCRPPDNQGSSLSSPLTLPPNGVLLPLSPAPTMPFHLMIPNWSRRSVLSRVKAVTVSLKSPAILRR